MTQNEHLEQLASAVADLQRRVEALERVPDELAAAVANVFAEDGCSATSSTLPGPGATGSIAEAPAAVDDRAAGTYLKGV